MAPPSGVETKLNYDAQLQTFIDPTTSKALLRSNAFWAKLIGRTLPFKSMTDRQTDRKTQKNSTSAKLGKVIQYFEYVPAAQKRLGV